MDKPLRISGLLFQEGEWWSAQCLEHDIATQAGTLPDLHSELRRILSVHAAVSLAEGRQPFDGLGPAPARYWKMFERAHLRLEADRDTPRADAASPEMQQPELRIAQLDLVA